MNVVRQDVFKEESGIDTPVNDYESFFFDESNVCTEWTLISFFNGILSSNFHYYLNLFVN